MNPKRARHRRPALAVSLALVLALPATGAAATDGTADAGHDTHPAAAAGEVVTLITGDRVRVDAGGDGRLSATVAPADRGDYRPTFETLDDGENLYVLPSDAAALVGEVLDPELFNVTKLVEFGYTGGTPVIITSEQGTAPAAVAAEGLSATATLASINATAATIDADGRWWQSVRSPATTPPSVAAAGLDGVAKVWLDGLAEVALEDSVPLIGAAHAWDAGFDGTGLTVAVLDTGIDADHPDLAGKVADAQNFTDEPDASDGHGHGTHVASTVAGTGAASDGARTGVAPGAQVLNGKVCNSSGSCPESAIIAGMEWGAANADVVNMSIGGGATDGTDPMSQAVNALTEQHDTLFVISAGNSGFGGDGTITTPGAAAAALTVGAVDKTEQLAGFSSRGPRLGDFAVKPDVTAPGVDIIAARAEGTGMGVPVDDDYTQASGTSMAAPHAAGAAAILLQQDGDLGAAEVKALLAATAVPHDELDVYQQGGGRIDLPQAVDAPVRAVPAPLDLGHFEYPHDDAEPVSAEVTYTNRADEEVTLDLSLQVGNRDGGEAGDDMLSVEPATVSVPAGGSATATVTLDVSVGELGLYGGYLVASSGDEVATRTPVGFHKEPEMHELRVEGIARDGRPAVGISSFHVLDVHDTSRFMETGNSFTDGVATLRVPPGTYHVMGIVYTYDGTINFTQERVMVGDPQVEVTEDTTVVLDARDATPLVIETPAHDEAAPIGTGSIAFYREAEQVGSLSASWTGAWQPTFAVATDPVTIGAFEFNTRTRVGAPPLALELVDPVAQDLAPLIMLGSPPIDDDVQLPVVFAGLGEPGDYDGIDAEGAAVLTQRGGPNHAEKEATARAHGAAALMVMNNTSGNYSGSVGAAAEIPAMTLSMEEGQLLRDLLDDGDVTVRMSGTSVTPYLYDLRLPEPDRIPDDLTFVAAPDELATVVNHFHSDVADHLMGEVRHTWRPFEIASFGFLEDLVVPLQRTEYLVGNDTRYRQNVYAEQPFTAQMLEPITMYEPGEVREPSWFKSPVRPGVLEGSPHQDGLPAVRDGNTLALQLPEWVDAEPGHWGWFHSAVDTGEFRLFENGDLIAEGTRANGEFEVGSDPAEYRVEVELSRDAAWWTTSTQTRTAWTFQSQAPTGDGPEIVPLMLVDYAVDLDLGNTAQQRFLQPVDLHIRHQAGADGARVQNPTVSVSYDDGETWSQRPAQPRGDGHFRVLLPPIPPGDAEFASLRVEATDRDGNGIEQEVIRAWKLP